MTGGVFVDTGALYCYVYKLQVSGANQQVYDDWLPGNLTNGSSSEVGCVTQVCAPVCSRTVRFHMIRNLETMRD